MTLSGDLLEALYMDNGTLALRQLRKLPPYLHRQGITLEDYDGQNAQRFELLPTKRQPGTLRPALTKGERLLLPGRATVPEES